MSLRVITEKEGWNDWARENDASFLQSWEWGEILRAEGKTVERLAVVENGEIMLQAQLFFTRLPFGWRYAFCPQGPMSDLRFKIYDFPAASGIPLWRERFYELLASYLKDKKCIFFRHEPALLVNQKSKIKNQKSPDVTPRATTMLDLTKSEEGLLGAMHEKTRYNIRLAEKKNLRLASGKDLAVLWGLMQETGERDRFRLHSRAHYEAILNSNFSRQLTLFTDEGQAAATGIFIGFGKIFTYLFGASHYATRNLMAPHLLQWEAIKLGKKLGFSRYDFFGITPPSESDNSSHQYAGVTRFKLGFGGSVLEKPGTYDLLITPKKYRIYQALRKLRRLM